MSMPFFFLIAREPGYEASDSWPLPHLPLISSDGLEDSVVVEAGVWLSRLGVGEI